MQRKVGSLALVALAVLMLGCSDRVTGPSVEGTTSIEARHAPMAMTATLSMVADYSTGTRWKDDAGVHARGIHAQFTMTGEAARSEVTGLGSCHLHFDIDFVTGDGLLWTTDEYKLDWADRSGCFHGGMLWTVRDFAVTGEMVHAGTGGCRGMEIRGTFIGAWGDDSFRVVGSITQ